MEDNELFDEVIFGINIDFIHAFIDSFIHEVTTISINQSSYLLTYLLQVYKTKMAGSKLKFNFGPNIHGTDVIA